MAKHLTLEQILEEAKHLKPEERLVLARNLLAHESPAEPKLDIRGLKGLGQEIWKGLDAQEYVNKERDSWD